MKKILVADNAEMNKSILHEVFSPQYEILQTGNSEMTVKYLTQYRSEISIVLISENIARSFQRDVVQSLASQKFFDGIPVILILNHSDFVHARLQGIELPYSDVISSPVNPYVIQKRVANLVELYSHKTQLEQLIQKQTAKILSQNKALKLQQRKINTINNDMLDTLSTVIEYRDVESGRHIHRIRKFTEVMLRALAERYPKYHMTEEKINLITSASSLHDIGKIAIPDSILLSPRRLNQSEFDIMKQHTIKGCELLNQLDFVKRNEYFSYCYDICRYHHEKFDGKGYPDGLIGHQIPIWAQVVSVADCYDALTSERPYKPAYSHETAVEMIRSGACGAFSEEMMDCFGAVLSDFKRLAAEYADPNHTDRSVQPSAEAVSGQTDPEDNYRVMSRVDLIRMVGAQKEVIQRLKKDQTYVLGHMADYIIEFDLERDRAVSLRGEAINLLGMAPKNYSEALMLLGQRCPEEYRMKLIRSFRLEEIPPQANRVVVECPLKVGGAIFNACRSTLIPMRRDGKIIRLMLCVQVLIFSSLGGALDELRTDRDTITGLWNSNGLRNEIQDYLEHSGKNGRHMMMLIDMDGFSTINRNTGYRYGNVILRDIGDMLRSQFADHHIIGRVEDDNYMVLVKDCSDREEGLSIVDTVFRMLHKSYTFEGKTYPELTASIGVSVYPSQGSNFDELFENVSRAVEIAKLNGKNMYLFYNSNMKGNWEILPYDGERREEPAREVTKYEQFFVPMADARSGEIKAYDAVEHSSEFGEEYDFDEIYSSLYYSSTVSAVSLNTLRRTLSLVQQLQEAGTILPKIHINTMFSGYDAGIATRAIEELLQTCPVDCSRICLRLTQDMFKTMNEREISEFIHFLKGYGFEVGVYNVGLKSIHTKCFVPHLFDVVVLSKALLDDVSTGLVPADVLYGLVDCFHALGASVVLPMRADESVVHLLRQNTSSPFAVYSSESLTPDEFSQTVEHQMVFRMYPALEYEKKAMVLSDRVYDELLEQTGSFIFEWLPRTDGAKFSGSFEKMYGYAPETIDFTKHLRENALIHADDLRKFMEKLSFARSETNDLECFVRFYSRRNDEYIWNRVRFMGVKTSSGVPSKIMAVCTGVTGDRDGQENQQRLDRMETLTNLYNRIAAENKIRSYLSEEGATGDHALMAIELCGFDLLEKGLGKVFAGAVLKELTQAVWESFRDSDIIGRVNGSQLVIFVKNNASRRSLRQKAEQIAALARRTYRVEDGSVTIIAKSGISLFPQNGCSYEELYSGALRALYYARHSLNSLFYFAADDLETKRLPAESTSL